MCATCFQRGFYGFPTWQDFEQFEQECRRKPLHPLTPDRARTLPDAEQYYQCPVCAELWVLARPENAWRGYFLPEGEAVAYTKRLTAQEQNRRLGCILMGMVLWALGLWRMLAT